ncbi:MAG: TRAP transporter substrate-binding protein [Lachnospiraceae bacterium]|nr:TRAP transporter substrate-binding protein [Lachnospiraceae bacterium]
MTNKKGKILLFILILSMVAFIGIAGVAVWNANEAHFRQSADQPETQQASPVPDSSPKEAIAGEANVLADKTSKTDSSKEESPSEEIDPAELPEENFILGNICVDGEPGTDAVKLFLSKLSEYSGGTLSGQDYSSYELGDSAQLLELVCNGSIEACLIKGDTLAKYDPRYALLSLPFAFSSYQQANAVAEASLPEWEKDGLLEENGLYRVSLWDNGFSYLTNSKRGVNVPEDIKNLTIRSRKENQSLFEELGANTISLTFGELMSGFRQGVVDGQENNLYVIYTNKLWESRQVYMTLTRHRWETLDLIVSKTWWDGLTSSQQKAVQKAAEDAKTYMFQEIPEKEEEILQDMEANGVQIIREIDRDAFLSAAQ